MMGLTRQEKEKIVLDLRSQGKTFREIAKEAQISPRDIVLIAHILITTAAYGQEEEGMSKLFEDNSSSIQQETNSNKTGYDEEYTAGINKGHEDRRACESSGIDMADCSQRPAVTCPTNYNSTQCTAYQNGYNTVFEMEKAFSKFYEGLGREAVQRGLIQ